MSRSLGLNCAPIVLTLAVCAATLAAQTSTQTRPDGAITGVVIDGSTGAPGGPAPWCRLRPCPPRRSARETRQITDDSGRFAFLRLPGRPPPTRSRPRRYGYLDGGHGRDIGPADHLRQVPIKTDGAGAQPEGPYSGSRHRFPASSVTNLVIPWSASMSASSGELTISRTRGLAAGPTSGDGRLRRRSHRGPRGRGATRVLVPSCTPRCRAVRRSGSSAPAIPTASRGHRRDEPSRRRALPLLRPPAERKTDGVHRWRFISRRRWLQEPLTIRQLQDGDY